MYTDVIADRNINCLDNNNFIKKDIVVSIIEKSAIFDDKNLLKFNFLVSRDRSIELLDPIIPSSISIVSTINLDLWRNSNNISHIGISRLTAYLLLPISELVKNIPISPRDAIQIKTLQLTSDLVPYSHISLLTIGFNDHIAKSMSTLPVSSTTLNTHKREITGHIPPDTTFIMLSVHYSLNYALPSLDQNSLILFLRKHLMKLSIQRISYPDLNPTATLISSPMFITLPDGLILQWESNCNLVDHSVSFSTKSPINTRDTEWNRSNMHSIQIEQGKYLHRVYRNSWPKVLYYAIRSGSTISRQYLANLFQEKSSPALYKLAILSDSQYAATQFRHHLWHIGSEFPDLFVHLGDMVHEGTSTKEWRTYWLAPLESSAMGSSLPVLTARGNHDGESALSYSYLPSPNGGWKAITYGSMRLIVLNSNYIPSITETSQTNWLKNELESSASQTASFRVVLVHVPPFVDHWDNDAWFLKKENAPSEAIKRFWVPLFEKYNVDLVVSGHSHIYQRGIRNKVNYCICGGGGASIDTERIVSSSDSFYLKTFYGFHFISLTTDNNVLNWKAMDSRNAIFDYIILASTVKQPTNAN